MSFSIEELLYALFHLPIAITSPFISWYFFRLSGGNFIGSGLIIAIPYIFQIFSSGIFGRLSDISWIGSKNLVLTSLVFLFFSYLSYYIIHDNSLLFFLAYIGFNLIISAFTPAFNRLISFYDEKERAEKFGKLGMMASVGFLIGSIVASLFINTRETYRNMFIIAAVTAFLAFLLAFKLKEVSLFDSNSSSKATTTISTSRFSFQINSSMKPVFILLVLFTLTQIANSVFASFFAIFVEGELNESINWVGIVNSVATLLGIFATFIVGKIVKNYKRKYLVLFALGLYTIVPFITYITNNTVLILALYSIPVYAIFFVVVPVFISENTLESQRGQAMGFYSSFTYLGLAIGTLSGAFLAYFTGYIRPNFFLGACVGFLAFLLGYLFFKDPLKKLTSLPNLQ
ncbi:MAG: MFS transporter [Candidatus Hodarchaeales archaeon]|jgi:MFS family permease